MNKISKKFKISKEYYLENIYLRGPGDISSGYPKRLNLIWISNGFNFFSLQNSRG